MEKLVSGNLTWEKDSGDTDLCKTLRTISGWSNLNFFSLLGTLKLLRSTINITKRISIIWLKQIKRHRGFLKELNY